MNWRVNWRAISLGIVTTVIVWLISQLIYVLVASAIGIVSSNQDMGFFSAYKEQLWFVTAMLVYCLTMIAGGLMTSFLAEDHFILNATLVGGITGCLIVATSLGMGQLTWISGLLILFGFIFAALGGWLWQHFFT